MSYTWLKYGYATRSDQNNSALGVMWGTHGYRLWYERSSANTIDSYPIGSTFGGGAWLYRRAPTANYCPYFRIMERAGSNSDPTLSNIGYAATTAQLDSAGIVGGSAYRLEWRITKTSRNQLHLRTYVNGVLALNQVLTVPETYLSKYLTLNSASMSGTTYVQWFREMYECDGDDPILGYWEFRTVQVTALPNQKLTTSQVRNGWTSDEGFSQQVTIDKSAIPEDNTVLAYITDHQLYAKKRSPRQSEQSFSTELHGTKSPIRTVSLISANTNPTEHSYRHYAATELEQPTLARDLDPTLRFDYQFTIEE